MLIVSKDHKFSLSIGKFLAHKIIECSVNNNVCYRLLITYKDPWNASVQTETIHYDDESKASDAMSDFIQQCKTNKLV